MKNNDNFYKRNKIENISSILTEAKQGETKTHLMYNSNLNYKQFKEYVKLLLEIGFLENQLCKIPGKQTLRTTSKGLKFLRKYAELKILMILHFTRN